MSKQFANLGIAEPILKALLDLKITVPTEIQQKSVPVLLSSQDDFIGLAKTGTGKTAAFGLPLLQLINVNNAKIQAVILVPTRELGNQIFTNLESFAKYLPEVSIASVCGGIPIKPQIERLQQTTHIVVATPGRLIDLIKRGAINIKEINYLILDEADEMATALKEGLDQIAIDLPKNRKTWLFSATMPGTVKQLVQNYMSKKVTQVSASMEIVGNSSINHEYIVVDPIEKLEVLMHFLTSKEGKRGIIFCKTKAAVNKLAKNLAINRFSSGAIHGSLTQPIRDRIMDQFRAGHINILVATDLAARGIDVKEISYVVNYHLPDVHETYVHRSGRTARAGANGFSLTILQQEEIAEIADFEKALGIKFEKFEKPNPESIEENNAYLWAKQIFKTKPNHELSIDIKEKIKTVFHHLTKDELIEKLMANYFLQNKPDTTPVVKRQKMK
ncbi:DEAD/DEAH box helicase [Flavobacterium psychrophilum]|uniref:DEAD/DEAH box helicase n=1 Tax=Flavobacterium psychrophilum TaxID=96345 RepID=UPI001C8FA3A8|nr:DEAD/DEAH box helicase [Flavobacterium psychrophilum]EKT4498426.1 DEAD/DEAH box helicase [Flavobacterium psychrophilum]ELY1992756.1 DEAD/DEAH box helicase [Flavobacterium psychrophilum]QZK98173.1 DEAD/DEAH box helicase [Flavobacterium psychrophilum]